MARLRPRWFSTPLTFVLGVLLAEIALLPVLPRIALAYGPVPVPATTAPATTAPPTTSPPTTASPPPSTPTSDAPPPYPPASAPSPGYPPAAQPPPPGYPPPGQPPPGYQRPHRRAAPEFDHFDAAAAAAAGERDASADSSGGAWFFLGCLLGAIGVIIAYVSEPNPPPARLIGKSPEWVIVYSAAYKTAGRSAQGKSAILGCLVITAVAVALIAASSSMSPQ